MTFSGDGLDAVVADAVAGNRDALRKVLETIRPIVVRYCRARFGVGERQGVSADDVAQEVCLAVITALPRYKDQGRPFLAFVYGIAAHKVADAHRAAGRNRAEATDDLPDATPTVAPLARRIDPGVLDILRAEAAFEARARAGGPAPVAPHPPDPPPMRLTPAQERLARLRQAEREGSPMHPADSEAAIEDPSAQRHGPRPPLIRPAPPGPEAAAEPAFPVLRRRADGRDLPVRIDAPSIAAYRAQQQRKGFRLGYGASVGMCCGLLALYLGAPQVARWLPAGTPLAERVIDHGDRVQAALVGALRAMLDAGAS